MQRWVEELNKLGKNRTPVFFIIDFLAEKAKLYPLKNIENQNIYFQLRGRNHLPKKKKFTTPLEVLNFKKLSSEEFEKPYTTVLKNLEKGNSYLINLSFCTPLQNKLNLEQIFTETKAKYKVLMADKWVCFSPETFVEIKENRIFTYPMKGTINAKIPNAKEVLLNNPKEIAEHNTIVDLLRNDLSAVAKNVRVSQFRYIENIKTQKGEILQASSEIIGELPENWQDNLGTLLKKLLPAGSISGAPKQKTIEIITQAENYHRGFYTGICGFFDGNTLDTGVMIRFIENIDGIFYYKSGGGITAQSRLEDEYNEIYEKIYLPL